MLTNCFSSGSDRVWRTSCSVVSVAAKLRNWMRIYCRTFFCMQEFINPSSGISAIHLPRRRRRVRVSGVDCSIIHRAKQASPPDRPSSATFLFFLWDNFAIQFSFSCHFTAWYAPFFLAHSTRVLVGPLRMIVSQEPHHSRKQSKVNTWWRSRISFCQLPFATRLASQKS